MEELVLEGCPVTGACKGLAVSRATLYRRRRPAVGACVRSSRRPSNALSPLERQSILDVLHQERFMDLTPREIVPQLADEGEYLGSIRTFYRILAENGEVRERRNQARHVKRTPPILEATAPNQVWTWDITRLKGPFQGVWYFLYLIIDIFSRYAVGWMVAERESARLAQHLIRNTVRKHLKPGDTIVLHSDRGPQMTANTTRELIALLGLMQSLSRPRTSDDNPFSEAQFRTLKYHAWFPPFYASKENALSSMDQLLTWYNNDHMHTGLNLLTPATVHFGKVAEVVQARQAVMNVAWSIHPERFSKGSPIVKRNPLIVGINRRLKAVEVTNNAEKAFT